MKILCSVLVLLLVVLSAKMSAAGNQILDVSSGGLPKYSLIEWKGEVNNRLRPTILLIKAKTRERRQFALLKLQLQGSRSRLVRMGPSKFACQLKDSVTKADLINEGGQFRILILVMRSLFNIYLNGKLITTARIQTDTATIDDIYQIRTFQAYREQSLRLLDDEMLASEMEETNCGSTAANSIEVPNFCSYVSLRKSEDEQRIVGGVNSNPGSNPWQVALRYKPEHAVTGQIHLCGGSLIARCWVVTAGHCLLNTARTSLDKRVIRVGDYNNRDGGADSRFAGAENSQDIDIEEVYKHEKFRFTPSPREDIVLIKLRTCVNYGTFIQPICLPRSKYQFKVNKECGISGWGALNYTNAPSQYPPCLQSAQVNIYSDNTCVQQLGRVKFLSKKMLCAATPTTDTCQGDSGGPLVCSENNRNFLWGITSWGEGCGNVKKPGVYVRVSNYLRWIYIHMKITPAFQPDSVETVRRQPHDTICHPSS